MADRDAGDREILDGAQRVHAPVGVGGHLALAEHVVLAPRRDIGERDRARRGQGERRVRLGGGGRHLRIWRRGSGGALFVDLFFIAKSSRRSRCFLGIASRVGAKPGFRAASDQAI